MNIFILLASDVEAATTWFRKYLGLKPAFEKAINFYGVLMNSVVIDNITIVLFEKPFPGSKSILLPDSVWPHKRFKVTDGSAIDHIGFSYDNIGPVLDSMTSSGVQIVRDAGVDIKHGLKSFFVRGPDGLLVEIVEEKRIPEGIWLQ